MLIDITIISIPFRLLRPNAAALTALGQHIPFEVAVGMNGRVWIKADTISHTILGANMITQSETIYRNFIPPSVLASETATVKDVNDNAMQVDSQSNYTKLELDACRQLIKQLIQQF
jgi:exosome complex RNA-binding protein Rrp4